MLSAVEQAALQCMKPLSTVNSVTFRCFASVSSQILKDNLRSQDHEQSILNRDGEAAVSQHCSGIWLVGLFNRVLRLMLLGLCAPSTGQAKRKVITEKLTAEKTRHSNKQQGER